MGWTPHEKGRVEALEKAVQGLAEAVAAIRASVVSVTLLVAEKANLGDVRDALGHLPRAPRDGNPVLAYRDREENE